MIGKLINKLQKTDALELFLKQLLNARFDESKVEELYTQNDININYLNIHNESFLYLCLEDSRIDAALWLLEKNIDVSIVTRKERTAFDIAIENQNHRIVKAILDREAVDINIKDIHGRTKLQDAIMLGDHEMAKILIEYGADLNEKDKKGQNILFDALSYGDLSFIDYLLTFKKLDLNNIDEFGNNVLHHKFALENDDMALKLIAKGVNPNLRNAQGHTYLSIVAQRGIEAFPIIESALENGFDINSRISDENTILMEVLSALSYIDPSDEAKRHSLLMMSEKLIDVGIDVNAVDKNNETALFQTIKSSDLKSTTMLLNKKADTNIQNKSGETALFYSCYGGIEKLELTILLLKHGADIRIENNKKQTIVEILNNLVLSNHGKLEFIDNDVMKYAISASRFMNVLKAIFKYSDKRLDFLDSEGNPIFYKPLLYDHIDLFKLYTKNSIDFQMTNKAGNNLFFEYVLKVFQDDNEKVDFETGLSMLISAKVPHNAQDETGWTVISKVVAQTPCNKKLFQALLKRVRFDYTIVDKLGRSIIHSAVWVGNIEVIKLINHINSEIKDIPDHYGLLPSIYAALIGNKKVLLYLMDLRSKIKTRKPISQAAIKKFTPLLKNIEKLKTEVVSNSDLDMLNSIMQQLQKDFVIK